MYFQLLIFLASVCSVASIRADITTELVDRLEKRWDLLENSWYEARKADNYRALFRIEEDMRVLFYTVRFTRDAIDEIAHSNGCDDSRNNAVRLLKKDGEALLIDGSFNAMCGLISQRVLRGSESVLYAFATIWKLYGLTEMVLGAIQIVRSALVVSRPKALMCKVLMRLVDLEQAIERFMGHDGIGERIPL